MFWALLAHLQEALHNNLCIACVLCWLAGTRVSASQHNTHRWASSAWNMYRLLIHNKLDTKSASCWSYCTVTCWIWVFISMRVRHHVHLTVGWPPILSCLCSGPFQIHRLVCRQNLYIAVTFFLYPVSTHWSAVLCFSLWQISINLILTEYAVHKNEGMSM
jgi:Pyruvate/2-oxoacid:ferredoxin oxidoreductase delta subunit